MKKIGIFFPCLRGNGACKVASTQSKMFIEAGYEVDIIVRDNNNPTFDYAGNIINLDVKSRKGLFKIITYVELFLKFRKNRKNNKYDIVISHTPHCDLINILTQNNKISIATVHADILKTYSRVAVILLNYIIAKSDVVITVSKAVDARVQTKFPNNKDKIKYIYNPVDIENILEQSYEPKPIHLKNEYILTAGRLSSEKGQWHLIKAFSLLSKKFPDLKLVILGDGDLRNKLENLVNELNLSNSVLFEGFQRNPYKYMRHAKISILSSLNEGLPLVLIESMVCSTPILSTDCMGVREIIAPSKQIDDSLDYSEMFEYGYLLPNFANIQNSYTSKLSEGEILLADKLQRVRIL